MAKKAKVDIKGERADTGVLDSSVYDSIERSKDRHGVQSEASPEEIRERQAELRTRGRKGCKLPRLTVSLSPDNLQYVKVMAGVLGLTLAQCVNFIIEQYRLEDPEAFEEAKALTERLKGGNK